VDEGEKILSQRRDPIFADHRRVLGEIVEGLNKIGLEERGKAVRVCLKDLPP
jgi:hypothetical protein